MDKIGFNINGFNYIGAKGYQNPNKITSRDKQEESRQDRVEISKEGIGSLNKKEIETNYDLARVLKIHKEGFNGISKEDSDYYWAARKSDQSLDSYLYESDKAEILKDMGKAQAIIMKVISGIKLTREEEKMVEEDPSLKQEIELQKAKASLYKQV